MLARPGPSCGIRNREGERCTLASGHSGLHYAHYSKGRKHFAFSYDAEASEPFSIIPAAGWCLGNFQCSEATDD
jgi:hypothetical protein